MIIFLILSMSYLLPSGESNNCKNLSYNDDNVFAQKNSRQLSLSAETIEAWENAGAQYGAITVDEFGLASFEENDLMKGKGNFPGFRIQENLVISKLPFPDVPFGLIYTKITEDTLKTLTSAKNLQILSLSGPTVNDLSIKGISGLTQLQTLRIRAEISCRKSA